MLQLHRQAGTTGILFSFKHSKPKEDKRTALPLPWSRGTYSFYQGSIGLYQVLATFTWPIAALAAASQTDHFPEKTPVVCFGSGLSIVEEGLLSNTQRKQRLLELYCW